MRARRPCPPAAPAAVDAAERAPRNNTIRWFRARAMLASAASAAKRLLVTTIEPRTRIVNCFFFLETHRSSPRFSGFGTYKNGVPNKT